MIGVGPVEMHYHEECRVQHLINLKLTHSLLEYLKEKEYNRYCYQGGPKVLERSASKCSEPQNQ